MLPVPTTDETLMLRELSPLVALDMDVSSRIRSVICKREKGGRFFL